MEDFEGLKQLYGGRSFRSLTDLPRLLDDDDYDARIPAPLVIAITEACDRRVSGFAKFSFVALSTKAMF